ncbi:MAG: cell wall metabolism sensor histidine kinase WalK [Defluviitaleaceae bacterium]|nr:cell wall metabolism sensor histidine kinase WalK [Defluviitaleaceae bacterium]
MDKLKNVRSFFNIILFKSIMSRLVLLYLALVFIVMIVSGMFIFINIRNLEAERVERDLRHTAILIEDRLIRNLPPDADPEQVERDLAILVPEGREILRVILDYEGNVIAPATGGSFQDSVIITAMTGQEDFQPWVRRAVGWATPEGGVARTWLNYAVPTFNSYNEIEYIIFLSMDASALLTNLDAVTRTIVLAVAIAMVLAAILGVLFSGTLTGPISSLTKTAGEMARGNLDQKIVVKSDDEIGQLTHSFNNLAESLSKTIFDMGSEKNRIEIILNNMTDGVLAYDSDNNLIHANYASSEMLDISDIEAVSFSHVMKTLGFDIDNSVELAKTPTADSVIEIGEKYVSVSCNTYRNIQGRAEGVVLVLQDVTKHAKLDNMRREFVANVSHEIRTPLTTIKSYTETLLEGSVDDEITTRNFLETINSETDRMTFLTADLLELSRFDNKQLSMQLEEADLVSLIKGSIRQNSVLAQNKKQIIEFEPPESSFPIVCDSSRINQVFNNVLSNSIKYSGDDTKITVTLTYSDKHYKISIKDQGLGIPREDLDRIFERFYRVDKARSRAMGGTGLGLAIAKEIMDAHEGRIYALSDAGNGTTMVLRFKRN